MFSKKKNIVATTSASTSNSTMDKDKSNHNERRSSIIPTPKCLQGPKFQQFWKIFKYVYVIVVIIFGLLLIFLNEIDIVHDWLGEKTEIVVLFLINDHWIYIILVLILITFMKSIGIKDVLGLRTISVVILAYRIVNTSRFATLAMTMFIIGILSSFSKLVEYQLIGHELQVVQGTPVLYIFKYLRILLGYCIKDPDKLEWIHPKWTFEISELSREDKSMDIITNWRVIENLSVCCNKHNGIDIESNMEIEKHRTDATDNDNDNDNDDERSRVRDIKHMFCNVVYFIIAVIWTSVIEWVQPITELFLFAHNWDLSVMKVVIIVFSEFADFDKAVEAMFIINELYSGKDIISAKAESLLAKPVFWTLGYFVVMPPTLLWAYYYHKKRLPQEPKAVDDNQEIQKAKKGNEKNGMENGFSTS